MVSHQVFIIQNEHRPSRTPPWLWGAMALCTWFLILYEAWETLQVIIRFREIVDMTGAFAVRYTMGPPIRLGMLLLLWFRFFMYEREGARIFALTAALLLFCVMVVVWVNTGLGNVSYSLILRWGLPICIIIYIAYAIRGRERMP